MPHLTEFVAIDIEAPSRAQSQSRIHAENLAASGAWVCGGLKELHIGFTGFATFTSTSDEPGSTAKALHEPNLHPPRIPSLPRNPLPRRRAPASFILTRRPTVPLLRSLSQNGPRQIGDSKKAGDIKSKSDDASSDRESRSCVDDGELETALFGHLTSSGSCGDGGGGGVQDDGGEAFCGSDLCSSYLNRFDLCLNQANKNTPTN